MRVLPQRQCSPSLAPITLMSCSLRRGVSSSPLNTVVVAAPHQAKGSISYKRSTKTPRGWHTKSTMMVHSRTKRKAATHYPLTLFGPNLALILSKHVLNPMDVINKHTQVAWLSSSMCMCFLLSPAAPIGRVEGHK